MWNINVSSSETKHTIWTQESNRILQFNKLAYTNSKNGVRFSDSVEYESQSQTNCVSRSWFMQMTNTYTIQCPTEKQQNDKHYAENQRLSNKNPTKTREWIQVSRKGAQLWYTGGTCRVTNFQNSVLPYHKSYLDYE